MKELILISVSVAVALTFVITTTHTRQQIDLAPKCDMLWIWTQSKNELRVIFDGQKIYTITSKTPITYEENK